MIGNILERKDQTSIFCPQSLNYQYVLSIKVKVAKIIFASALIVCGVWIIILTI